MQKPNLLLLQLKQLVKVMLRVTHFHGTFHFIRDNIVSEKLNFFPFRRTGVRAHGSTIIFRVPQNCRKKFNNARDIKFHVWKTLETTTSTPRPKIEKISKIDKNFHFPATERFTLRFINFFFYSPAPGANFFNSSCFFFFFFLQHLPIWARNEETKRKIFSSSPLAFSFFVFFWFESK